MKIGSALPLYSPSRAALAVPLAVPPGRVRFAPLQLLPQSPSLSVGIPSERLVQNCDPAGFGRQARSNWCWAACSQMVLNYHGLPVRQEQLVAKMFGGLPDLPMSGPGITAALNDWSLDVNGRVCRITADPVHLDNATVLDDLHRGNPLILGLANPDGSGGHAYVLTGARFHFGALGEPVIDSLVLRNPWPDSPSREELSAGEVAARMRFATRVLVQR